MRARGDLVVWREAGGGRGGSGSLAVRVRLVVVEGRVAIHGTADPSDRGRHVSHGRVRVYNPERLPLRDVPLGTPVVIED
ncbi:MAG TPA: L,D-transpeptidase [Actinomycetota bacterium]|nr:L,D-transpeptidase [Actinomycetota bacterium]